MAHLSTAPMATPPIPGAAAKLLIPIDAREESHWAIQYAIHKAQDGQAVEVFLLYVIEPIQRWEVLRFHTEQEIRQRFEERSAIFLAEAAEALSEAGIPCHRYCSEDEAVRGILAFAEEKGCSEIVVPRTAFWGIFPYGLASKLEKRSKNIPVVQAMPDGSPQP